MGDVTPLEGLMDGHLAAVMSTLRRHGVDCRGNPADLSDLERVANTASGLLGISVFPPDLRVLEQRRGMSGPCPRLPGD